MATTSGTNKEGAQQGHVYNTSSNNGSIVHGMEGGGVPSFQHQPTISMDWTPEEQAILEEGLDQYASESNIIRYAKIALQLKTKTVRDVALRCRWMTKKELSKRRKEDFNAQRRGKDRKEKFIDPSVKAPRSTLQPALCHALGTVTNNNVNRNSYNDTDGVTKQLLQQNTWIFEQINANISAHQIHENIGLLSQARDNIHKLLNNLNDMGPTMMKMEPLPKLNEELANTILRPRTLPMQ